MNQHFECTFFGFENGKSTSYTLLLEEIAAHEREEKELLGKAAGRDLGHCVYLGARHGKDFLERVKWYCVSTEEDESLRALRAVQPETIQVEFYGVKS